MYFVFIYVMGVESLFQAVETQADEFFFSRVIFLHHIGFG